MRSIYPLQLNKLNNQQLQMCMTNKIYVPKFYMRTGAYYIKSTSEIY